MRRLVLVLFLLLPVVTVASAGEAGSSLGDASGGSIIYLSNRTANGEVDAIDPRGARIRQLVRDVYEAIWSPDGKKLAFLREVPATDSLGDFDLYVVRANGRGEERLATHFLASCPAPDLGSISWSPDSSTIAFLRQTNCHDRREIWSVDVARGKLRRLAQASTPPYSFASLAWSPSGRQIAFVEYAAGSYFGDLYLMSANGTGQRLISGGDVYTSSSLSWAPDGRRLVYDGGAVGVKIVDVRARKARLPTGACFCDPQWSPDGKWIAFGSSHGVRLIKPDGKGLRQLGPSDYSVGASAWSPDSKNVAIAQGDIWVVPIDGSRPRRVTQSWRYGTNIYYPQWQPAEVPISRLWGPYVSPAFPSDSIQAGDVLETTHRVSHLAADGSRVALAYDPGQSRDPYARYTVRTEVWDPGSKAITVLGNGCEGWGACFGIAIAGERVGELFIATPTIHNDSIGLRTGTLGAPRMRVGEGDICSSGGWQCLGVPIDDLLGSGSLLVFDTWSTPCQLSHAGCTGRPKTNGNLFRLDGTQVAQIASSAGALTPLSVDAGRILVDHEDGTMEIRAADGSVLRSFSFDEASVRGARLQGNDLVVQTPTAIEVTDATTEIFQRRWPIPTPDATLTDLQSGIAVLVAGTDIHLVRLSDGTKAVIHVPGGGPVLAQLEPSGLFYSYTDDDSKYPGRIVFVPYNQLPIR
jgi:Tol biopolymer transport system component